MRSLKLATLAIFATAAMSAQDLKMDEVPSNLADTFKKEYPQATDVEWEMDMANYKVEFDVNRMEHELWYSKEGKVMKSEMELTETDLPAAIASVLKSKYADYKVDSVEVTEENGAKTYEVDLEKGWNEELDLVFSANGEVLSEMKD
ncbi:PepSY-like domain-containing protein [Subsaximicrobium wynnwilliamsii]|nr:PepSY-like domain-containing protein [Subsaximicrobium wynnwilliamsii]